MTEEEAKKKWCPAAFASSGQYHRNRDDNGTASARCMCLGSGCMAFKYARMSNDSGYCGLAGGQHIE